MLEAFKILFLLLCGHGIVDYSLQTDYVARGKNRHAIPPGYDPVLHGPIQIVWPYVLTAHALEHGLAVFLVTNSLALGLAETAAHWIIDFGKCEKWYGIHVDQWLHISCKLIWWWIACR